MGRTGNGVKLGGNLAGMVAGVEAGDNVDGRAAGEQMVCKRRVGVSQRRRRPDSGNPGPSLLAHRGTPAPGVRPASLTFSAGWPMAQLNIASWKRRQH